MASATGIEASPRKIWNDVGEAPLSESTGKTMNTWTLGCFRNDKSFKKKIAIVQTTPPRVKNGKNRPKLLRQQIARQRKEGGSQAAVFNKESFWKHPSLAIKWTLESVL